MSLRFLLGVLLLCPAAFAAYTTTPAVLTATRGEILLNGEWRFAPARSSSAPAEESAWGVIRVPGAWNRERDLVRRGEGEAWSAFQGEQLAEAWYEREVAVPAEWAGRAIELELDRVSTDATVFVGERRAGEIRWPGGALDIGRLVKAGEPARLRLKVRAVDDRSEVEIRMGYVVNERQAARLDTRGLIGAARLRSRPDGAHIRDVLVRPSTRKNQLRLDIEHTGVAAAATARVRAELGAPGGAVERVLEGTVGLEPGSQTATVVFDWPDARRWDLGRPELYALRLRVDGGGIADEFLVPRFGFREFWIEGKKFFLNNTEIRLRPFEYVGGEAARAVAFGYNFAERPGKDFARRGSEHDDDALIADADRAGLLVAASAGHWTDAVGRWAEPGVRAEWEGITARELRRHRNSPSVVSWAHSFNGFQWPGDGNPRYLGKTGFSSIQEYEIAWGRVREAIAFVKSLNGGQPVFAHFGTYFGDVHTSNLYLNFLPLQEREEWLSNWAREGTIPWMACELGLPLYASTSRGRDGYTHQGHSEPLNTEWMALYLGREAYALETSRYRDEVISARYRGGDRQREYEPHIRYDRKDELVWAAPAHDRVLTLHIENTFRSWRTMGMTGGAVPWHTPWHEALARVNGPTLAWIAGPGGLPGESPEGEAFTSKDHSFVSGERIEKQVVLLNDAREPLPFRYTWRARQAGAVIAEGDQEGRLEVAETRMSPFSFVAAALAVGEAKQDGVIELEATIGETRHTHAFEYRVFAPSSAPRPAPRVQVHDPLGLTARMLRGLGYEVVEWKGAPLAGVPAVIGREALSRGGSMPPGWRKFLREGGRLAIFAQAQPWLKHSLDLRVSPYVARRVFPVDATHAVAAGLDAKDLADWRGHGTLRESHPSYAGFEWVPRHGWRWGNRGSVTSAATEKPHRGSWRPLLETEWDLAYTPLMEMEVGAGRLTLCTLDLEDYWERDPAARRLAVNVVEHVRGGAITPKAKRSLYLGGEAGRRTLELLGLRHEKAATVPAPGSAQLLVVGPDASPELGALGAFARAGGKVLFLARGAAGKRGGVELAEDAEAVGSLSVPVWPEAAGLSASDLRWRAKAKAHRIVAGEGFEIGADGFLARRREGAGVILHAQVGPDMLPADELRYFRYTRWRQTRALSQILSNLGASFQADEAFLDLLENPKPAWMLAGEWDVQHTVRRAESPVREWNANPGVSERARRLVRPDVVDREWEKRRVPAYLESYGGSWRRADGEVVYRKEFEVPAAWAGRDFFLTLGRVDEEETTFFNGERIGSSDAWLFGRGHLIPGKHVKAGRNVLGVVAWDRGVHGGWMGDPDQISLRVAGPRAPFYHPDYQSDEIDQNANTPEAWERDHEAWKVSDEPYRYYRW